MARNLQLQSLIGKEKLESILEAFTKATGIASIITNVDGTPITDPHNFTPLCSNYCRKTDEGNLHEVGIKFVGILPPNFKEMIMEFGPSLWGEAD